MRRYCPSDHRGGSRFRGFALAFTSLARELASEIQDFAESLQQARNFVNVAV